MQEQDPRVTVIIPTYNRAAWLSEAVRSVLAERYPLRLLVVDNASTDDTAAVVAGFDDPRLTYVRRPANVGMVANFNDGLDRVETEYALIVSDDDLVKPGALEATVPALDDHPSVGVVHTRFDVIGADGEVLIPDTDWSPAWRAGALESGAEYRRKALKHGPRICSTTAVIRMSALEGLRYVPEEYPAFDLGLWLRMSMSWDFLFLPRSLFAYRVHPTSGSAEYGAVNGGYYVHGPEILDQMRRVKLTFLDERAGDLEDVEALRALATGGNHELLTLAFKSTLPDNRPVATAKALLTAARQSPSVLGERGAWTMLGGSFLRPGGKRRVKAVARRVQGDRRALRRTTAAAR